MVTVDTSRVVRILLPVTALILGYVVARKKES